MKKTFTKLIEYKKIFEDREDFKIISKLENINEILEFLDYLSQENYKNINLNEYVNYNLELLKIYLKNLKSFYSVLNGGKEPDDKKYILLKEKIILIINILSKFSIKEIENIGRGNLNTIKKDIIYGLNGIYEYLKKRIDLNEGFKDITINLSIQEMKNLILNENIGLGKKYNFNETGKHSFVNKLQDIKEIPILKVILKMLEKYPDYDLRKIGKVHDLGKGKDPIRIIIRPPQKKFGKLFKKPEVLEMYLTSGEHDIYAKRITQIRFGNI